MDSPNTEILGKIENVISVINGLKNEGSTNKTIAKRIDLLLIGMTYVEMAFNELIKFKETHNRFDIIPTITYDYRVSDYANRFYKQSDLVISVWQKTRQIDTEMMDKNIKFLNLTKRMMTIAARFHCERFINVYEFDTPVENRAFPKRKPLLEECIYFLDKMIVNQMKVDIRTEIRPKKIIFAVQPNGGKSFVANVYSVLATCLAHLYYKTSGILRMSNNMGNAIGFSNQCMAMLLNDKIAEIFPEYKQFFRDGKPRILDKSTAEEWKLADLDPKIRASFFARGRETAINSIRIFVALVLDDLSDGVEQMSNDEAHKAMTTKYEIDMESRKDNENVPELIVGTMFNEFDVPNQIIRKLEDAGLLLKSKKFPDVRHTADYSIIVITVDCFDEKGESKAPLLISTEKLKDKQASLKPFEFDLVYRQIRSSREPRIFDYGNLKTYRVLPKTISEYATAVVDPTRTNGNDYFSMPIFRYNEADGLWYFTDCIYEQKSLGKISDPYNIFLEKVVKFIIDNKIVRFTIENNTSNTIGTIIEEKLKQKKYTSCVIQEIYTSRIKGKGKGHSSKMQRILDQEATIVRNVVFPAPSVFPPNHRMTLFMEHFTRYDTKDFSYNRKNHDDAPDSMAMFSEYYLFNKSNRLATIGGCSKRAIFGG